MYSTNLKSGNVATFHPFLTDAEDKHNNQDAVLQAGATINNGLVLNGTTSYAMIGNVLSDMRWAGAVAMRFKLNAAFTSAFYLFMKPHQPNYNSFFGAFIDTNGAFKVASSGTSNLGGTPRIWTANTEYTVIVTWDALFVIVYINGVFYAKFPYENKHPVGNELPLFIGMEYGYGQSYGWANITVTDFLVQEYTVTKAQAEAYHEKRAIAPRLEDKIFPQKGTIVVPKGPAGSVDAALNCEPIVFIKSDNSIYLVSTLMNYDYLTTGQYVHYLGKQTAPHPLGPYTKHGAIIGPGYVGNRSAGHAWGIQKPEAWYIYYTNAPVSDGFFIAKSVDEGNTWTDEGLLFTTQSILGVSGKPFGNISIHPEKVNGFYHAILEAGTREGTGSIWECNWIRSLELNTGWQLVQKITDQLQFAASGNGSVANPWHTYRGGKWHCFFGYTGDEQLANFTTDLPSRCCYTTSDDMANWGKKQPFLDLWDKPLGINTDQAADPEPVEWNGEVYVFASYMVNPAVWHPNAPYQGEIAVWSTGLTMDEFLEARTVEVPENEIFTATENLTFGEANRTEVNTKIIYETELILKSWKPGRSINALEGFTAGKKYLIVPAD